LELGRAVGSSIEDLFRGAHWLGSRRQGFDAATAGKATKDLHFDYDALTPFEKNVMRRAIPFYTFGSRNLPMQAKRLASTPATSVAQLRVMAAGSDPANPLPDSLASGLTIPVGQSDDGKSRYLNGFGLPIEDALSRVPFKGGLPDMLGSARSWLSGVNPLVEGPLESLAGVDFFSGRKLTDLRPQATASAIGRLFGDDNPQLLSRVLANSPAARFVSTADRLADDRKGAATKALALATGLRLSDVDLEKARNAEAGQARNELMASMPHLRGFTNYSARPGETLTPAEVALLRLQALARQASRENAKGSPQRIGLPRP
jgi:hypothetical protein